jgi:staphylococcal nuclease domain-containing protein 1
MLRIIGTGTSALETMMTQFRAFHLNSSNSAGLPGPPKAGDYVAAKFSEDGNWYRARIRSNDRTAKEAEVVYIDYGNSEKIPWARLRPLSQPQFTKDKLKAQAVDAVLSLIQLPTNRDYRLDAISFISEVAANRRIVANVDYISPEGTLHVTLYDPEATKTATDSINQDIVAEGHAMVHSDFTAYETSNNVAQVPNKLKPWERAYGNILKSLTAKMEVCFIISGGI